MRERLFHLEFLHYLRYKTNGVLTAENRIFSDVASERRPLIRNIGGTVSFQTSKELLYISMCR